MIFYRRSLCLQTCLFLSVFQSQNCVFRHEEGHSRMREYSQLYSNHIAPHKRHRKSRISDLILLYLNFSQLCITCRRLLQKKFGIGSRNYYFNSLSLLEKFPISSTSIIKKDNILSRNANLPVESVLQTALPTPRITGLPSLVVVFPTCRKV